MVIFFGPPGAGKSVQGQLLAARHGWRWLSTGQLLRDAHDLAIQAVMSRGELVSDRKINSVIGNALKQAKDIDGVILDGFPRNVDQAKWLLDSLDTYDRKIITVICLEVPNNELYQRLKIRGRADDTLQNIAKRSGEYSGKTKPVLDHLKEHGIVVKIVDGEGSVGTVHDRVEEALVECIQK